MDNHRIHILLHAQTRCIRLSKMKWNGKNFPEKKAGEIFLVMNCMGELRVLS